MQASEALDVSREAIFVMLKIGGPIMLVALLVGLVISLIQALTQMQEMTLSFVPKIVVMFVALMLFLPFMLSTLTTFTEQIAARISGG
jgi:flagellar biosynthesis protein FliQ